MSFISTAGYKLAWGGLGGWPGGGGLTEALAVHLILASLAVLLTVTEPLQGYAQVVQALELVCRTAGLAVLLQTDRGGIRVTLTGRQVVRLRNLGTVRVITKQPFLKGHISESANDSQCYSLLFIYSMITANGGENACLSWWPTGRPTKQPSWWLGGGGGGCRLH